MHRNNAAHTGFTGSEADARKTREAIILQYVSHVNFLARRLKVRVPPSVTFDDLVGAGTVGLIQAVDRFQPSRGLTLGTYARHRIWGAMQDFLRGEDPLSRSERRRVRATSPTSGEAGLPFTISLEQLPTGCAQTGCPESQFTNRLAIKQLRHCLSAREDRVISLLYEFEWKNRDVARELGVNESRVSQIKHVALSKLRARLQEHAAGVAA
jgi:RNA polymerase sigma factor for flagellar operon FliA